ncbi:MAG: beta strand repeat-containing protein [Planctomycetaceae bacterium]
MPTHDPLPHGEQSRAVIALAMAAHHVGPRRTAVRRQRAGLFVSLVRRSLASLIGPIGFVLVTAIVAGGVSRAVAVDTQWTGAVSDLWTTAGNWSAGVPTSSDNAQLFSSASNTTIDLPGLHGANQLQVGAGATYTLSSTAGSILALSDQLFVFSDGSSTSSLTIGGSLSVNSPNGSMGTGTNTVGSTLTVNGQAVVEITDTFNVGYESRDNVLQVSGTFRAGNLFVGTLATGTSNDLNITGGTVTATNSLVVGSAGSFNSLVSTGTLTVTGPGGVDIGTAVTATSNSLSLSAGAFSATNTLIVGRAGDSNSFTVQLGSTATTGQVRIGLDAGADGNSATLSGPVSQWTVNGTVIVGNFGDTNSLAVLNGGAMTVSGLSKNLWIGKETGSDNNVVTVDGAGSVLNVTGVGSEVVISATNGTGNKLVLSNSGSANVNSIQTGPGGTLQIGDSGAAGFLKNSATITGNAGGGGFGGGIVEFKHNDASFTFANRMTGPLSVTHAGSGKTTLTGSSAYTGKTTISSGTLALSGSANIASSGTIEVASGAGYDVSAVTGGYQLAGGQKLQGDGSVIGPATAAVGSTVIPGTDGTVGTLSLTGPFSLLGDLKIDISGSTIDMLDGPSDSLTLGGGSSVTFNELAAITTNLIFAKYVSLTGTFGSVNGLPSGYSIDYNYFGGNQIALVSSVVPEIDPASATGVLAMVTGALGLVERRLRRRRG